MDKHLVQQLMYSVVQFLRSQLESPGSLSDEGVESVEVALQCLETAYSLTPENAPPPATTPLYDIFVEAVGDQVAKSETAPKTTAVRTEASPEDKAEAELFKNEGNLRMREEQFGDAMEQYTRAIHKDGGNAVYYCNRAAAHNKMLNHNEAIEDCRRALDIEPNYSKAYGRMGLAFSSMNNFPKAKECYEMALYLDPENESCKTNLAIAEEKIKAALAQQQSSSATPANPFAALAGGGLSAMAGLGPGGGQPDLTGILNNPALMNMATQLLMDPNMHNMMSQFLGGMGGSASTSPMSTNPPASSSTTIPTPTPSTTTPPPPPPPPAAVAAAAAAAAAAAPNAANVNDPDRLSALLNAGRQLAEQMQNQHPQLVEQLRTQLNRPGEDPPQEGNPPNES